MLSLLKHLPKTLFLDSRSPFSVPTGRGIRKLIGLIFTLYGIPYFTGITGLVPGNSPWNDIGLIYLPMEVGGALLVSAGLVLLLTLNKNTRVLGHIAAVYSTVVSAFTIIGWYDRFAPLLLFACLAWALFGQVFERWEV